MSGKLKKTIIMHIPYLFIGLFATKLGQMWRYTDGAELGERILNLGEGFFAAMENPIKTLPSLPRLPCSCCQSRR